MSNSTQQKRNIRGFSLLESAITISLLSACISVGLAENLDTLYVGSARSDRTLLISTLREARLRSLNRLCEAKNCAKAAPHGVYVEHNQLILFEGATYASRIQGLDIHIPFSSDEVVCGTTNEISFLPSGNAISSTSISILGKDSRTEVVLIGLHGGIVAHIQS